MDSDQVLYEGSTNLISKKEMDIDQVHVWGLNQPHH
jgi:hypothetical protein